MYIIYIYTDTCDMRVYTNIRAKEILVRTIEPFV